MTSTLGTPTNNDWTCNHSLVPLSTVYKQNSCTAVLMKNPTVTPQEAMEGSRSGVAAGLCETDHRSGKYLGCMVSTKCCLHSC